MTRRAPWVLAVFSVILAVAGVALALAGERSGLDLPQGRASELYLKLASAVAAVLFAVVGLVIARKVQHNPIGSIFLGIAAAFALVSVSYGYADLALYGGHAWPAGAWAAWLASWLVVVPAFEGPCVVAQLFPDGRPMPGAWKRLLRLSFVIGVYLVLPAALDPGRLGSYPTTDNPTELPRWVGTLLFDPVWGVCIFALLGISLASVVVRFRRSRGIERQQLTWLALVAGVTIAGLVVAFLFNDVSSLIASAAWVVTVVGLLSMPVAVAVAILRYRLYDIDRVVSRTLTYGAVTIVLGAAYVGLVLAGQALFSSFAGGSNLAIAISTLVVAALFLPLRTRVQRVVDRRFYRRRYDAQRTLEAFGSRLREQVDLETLTYELQDAVAETMQPRDVNLWLRHEATP